MISYLFIFSAIFESSFLTLNYIGAQYRAIIFVFCLYNIYRYASLRRKMACGRSTRRIRRQVRTAQATAERKCMTLPLAYIFLCRYVKREASSEAAIARYGVAVETSEEREQIAFYSVSTGN